MPQLVKKRRSGWAVLAAGALIASLFAVGAAPAAAAPIDSTAVAQVSAFPLKTACLGPALADAGFTDVATDNAHRDAINCIAHYGITAGTGDGSFGAAHGVTRSQMALFLSAMATLAGLELDDAMDAGFTDLDDVGDNRVSAINRLVNGGVMTGTSDDTFSPGAAVTRADMALWLANFVVAATDDDSFANVEKNRDGTYKISQAAPTAADADARNNIAFDHFPDARLTQPAHIDSAISAVFELGISTGYGDNEFKGHRDVTRAEMATFLTRTLAHTNVRPAGLTAQHDGEGGIQVSLRTADFAPVANEPIDLFRSYFPDYSFKDNGTCETRYVTPVLPSHDACEIDPGDTVTEDNGNKDYTAADLKGGGEDSQVICGTGDDAVTFDLGSADDAPAIFWVWTGELEDTVDADTNLVKVGDVDGVGRSGALAPHHANVSGGLDAMKNQLEAKMGSNVRLTLQLHGINPADSKHAPAAPDASGNKYEVVVQVNEITADGGGAFTGDGQANSRNAVRVGTDTTYDEGTLLSRTPPRVMSPDSSGQLLIAVTYADPDRSRNNADVVVTVEVKAHQVGSSDPTARDYNPDFNKIDWFDHVAPNILPDDGTAPDVTVDDDYTTGFETKVIFSDDKPNPYMYAITAAAPVYKLARGPNRPVGSYVDISAVDQYGNPVRGLSVNAVSDQTTTQFPFVQYFTTRSNGSYRVSYTYHGAPVVETLTAFAAIANQAYDHDDDTNTPDAMRLPNRDTTTGDRILEEPAADGIWGLLLPGTTEDAKPDKKVYWAYVGRQTASPSGGYTYAADADTGLLAVDVPNKALLVFQTADGGASPPVIGGPHVYYWDEHDTFQVGSTAVSMALFEDIVSHKDVTLGTLTWTSYNYNRPNDRAHWTITCI